MIDAGEFNSRKDIDAALDAMFLAGFVRADIEAALDRVCGRA